MHWNAQPFGHLFRELLALRRIAPISARGFQLSNRRNRFELCLRLAPSANDCRDASILARQVFRGHTGSGTGPQLPHVVRFDQRQQIARRHFVDRNKKPQLATHKGVLLHRDKAQGEIRGGHIVKESATGQFESPARVDDHFPPRPPLPSGFLTPPPAPPRCEGGSPFPPPPHAGRSKRGRTPPEPRIPPRPPF